MLWLIQAVDPDYPLPGLNSALYDPIEGTASLDLFDTARCDSCQDMDHVTPCGRHEVGLDFGQLLYALASGCNADQVKWHDVRPATLPPADLCGAQP